MAIPNFSREQILAEIARREAAKKAQQKEEEKEAPIKKASPRRQTQRARPVQQKSATPPKQKRVEPEQSEYKIDKKTGKKYKTLKPQSKEAMAATTVDGLLRHMDLNDDIRGFGNLNVAAENFLAPLRVAPTKEELKQLREEKLKQIREQNKEYEEILLESEQNQEEGFNSEDL